MIAQISKKKYYKMKNAKFECDSIKDEHTEPKKEIYIGDIKSAYIIRDIFSLINKKEKLNLIKYNKR